MFKRRALKIAFVLAFFALVAGSMAYVGMRKTTINARIAALSDPARTLRRSSEMQGDRPRLYLIGESSLTRWPTSNFAAGRETINCSLGQETTAQLTQRIANFDFLRPQDAVLISSGLYDLVAASLFDSTRASAAVEQTTRALFDLARSASASARQVLLATLIPPSARDDNRRERWREPLRDLVAQANQRLRQSTQNGRIAIVDFAAALGSDDRVTPSNYRIDALHVNAIANRKLVDAVERALAAR